MDSKNPARQSPRFAGTNRSEEGSGGAGEGSRVSRLLRIAQAVREDPFQSLKTLLEKLGIGRSQFYKDKAALAEVGFKFTYSKARGFSITEDQLTPITGLSVSDRLLLMLALEQLCQAGDGTIATMAVEAGRKLVGGLPAPFREEMSSSFENMVTSTLGVQTAIWTTLRDCILAQQRTRILYTRSGTWDQRWREVDPRYLYMRDRTLYLYARTADEKPATWKVFRLSRMARVEATGISVNWRPGDDGDFAQKKRNAFNAFIGDQTHRVVVRFRGEAAHYVSERQWHSSDVKQREPGGGLIYQVTVAEPMEVVRWARQFGDEAEVLDISPVLPESHDDSQEE